MRVIQSVSGLSQQQINLLSAALILIVGGLDYITGAELNVSIFYLVPVAVASWYVGRRAGIITSFASVVVWMIADAETGRAFSSLAVLFWNALVRLGFLLIVTATLTSLIEAQRRQEQLVHFIIHDLRSPVTNVLSGLQYLLMIDKNSDDEVKDVIYSSIASCNSMITLIGSLLDTARLEQGRMVLRQRNVGVDELMERTLEQVEAQAARNEVLITTEVKEDAARVQADPELTVRVLVNLLHNAVKHSPMKSTVHVRVGVKGDEAVMFSVTDEGQGIPEEWIDKVFDKFVQADAHQSGTTVGSGLGLYFCKLAIEAQGGHIWLDSEPGKGTKVYFTLPRVAATVTI